MFNFFYRFLRNRHSTHLVFHSSSDIFKTQTNKQANVNYVVVTEKETIYYKLKKVIISEFIFCHYFLRS